MLQDAATAAAAAVHLTSKCHLTEMDKKYLTHCTALRLPLGFWHNTYCCAKKESSIRIIVVF